MEDTDRGRGDEIHEARCKRRGQRVALGRGSGGRAHVHGRDARPEHATTSGPPSGCGRQQRILRGGRCPCWCDRGRRARCGQGRKGPGHTREANRGSRGVARGDCRGRPLSGRQRAGIGQHRRFRRRPDDSGRHRFARRARTKGNHGAIRLEDHRNVSAARYWRRARSGISLADIGSFRYHHRLHRRVGAADRSHLPEKDVRAPPRLQLRAPGAHGIARGARPGSLVVDHNARFRRQGGVETAPQRHSHRAGARPGIRHRAPGERGGGRRPRSAFSSGGVHAWIQPRCSACWILRGNRLFVRDEVAALLASRAARVRRGRVARPTAQESITRRESVPPG